MENLDKSQLKIGIWGGKRLFVKNCPSNVTVVQRNARFLLWMVACCKTFFVDMQYKLDVNLLQCLLMSLVLDWFSFFKTGSLSSCFSEAMKTTLFILFNVTFIIFRVSAFIV